MVNKLNQEREKRRVLNQLRYQSLSGSRMNSFNYYGSESENHIRLKFETFLRLRKLGYDCWCEPIFKCGIRMDILAWKDGKFKDLEILSSETIEQLNEKIKKYPNIEIVKIKSINDLDYLE